MKLLNACLLFTICCSSTPSMYQVYENDTSSEKDDKETDKTETDSGSDFTDSDTDQEDTEISADSGQGSDTDQEDTEISADSGQDIDTGQEDSGISADSGQDSGYDSGTDTDPCCPWECKQDTGIFSCDLFDPNWGTPKYIHNWNYVCPDKEICCQPFGLIDGVIDYCGDFKNTECSQKECKGHQELNFYCNSATYRCCEKGSLSNDKKMWKSI